MALVGVDVFDDDGVERLGHVTTEEPEHERVGLLGPRAAAVGGQGVGEELFEVSISSSLSRDATWRKLGHDGLPRQGESASSQNESAA
jgi:hypothetical protein